MAENRWRLLLLALCVVGSVVLFAVAADHFGLGGEPWNGYGDHHPVATGRPYVIEEQQALPGGAAWRAGLRDGDLIDIRNQTLDSRYRFVTTAWLTTRATILNVRRGLQTFTVQMVGSSVYDGAWQLKVVSYGLLVVANAWFLCCAFLIALRRASSPDARILVLVLLTQIGALITPAANAVPDLTMGFINLVGYAVFTAASSVLLVILSARFGRRSQWRTFLEWLAYAVNALAFLISAVAAIGIATLWVDPWPFIDGQLTSIVLDAASVTVVLAAAAAVSSTAPSQRPRAAWLLLPLPVAFAFAAIAANVYPFVNSWYLYFFMYAVSSALLLLGAFAVSYALLKRRVLDAGFILSRTIVVAGVSLVVVAAFVLLEWVLGNVLTSASHATGVIANAALALVLGVSLRSIHQRVDALVDRWLFRARYENERALRDFSTEAGFVTDSDALLDRALENLRAHTDARSAALFLNEDGVFRPVRQFGGITAEVSENDSAILALKTWHKPLDPHRYETALHGDLALPMVARGRLLGLLLCGERAGGEAYAADEIAALSEFARGVGSAIETLQGASPHERRELLAAIETNSAAIFSLRESVIVSRCAYRTRKSMPVSVVGSDGSVTVRRSFAVPPSTCTT